MAPTGEEPGCRSRGDAEGNLLTVPCQVGLASPGPRGGPAGCLLPGKERVACHRLPAAGAPRLGLGRDAQGADVVSTRVLEPGLIWPGEGAQNPGPGQGRGWGGTACSMLSGTSDWEGWGWGRLRHTPLPRWLAAGLDPGKGGMGCPPGRALAWSTVFPGVGGGGREAPSTPPPPAACLTARWGCLSGPPPPRDSPGLCRPLAGLGWEGCALPPPSPVYFTVMSYDSVTAAGCRVGVSFCASGLGSWAPRARGCHLFSYAFKERFLPPSPSWP